MIDLDKINPNEYPGTPGSILATILELTIMNMATNSVILENQAIIASKLDPVLDEEKYIKHSEEDINERFNKLKAEIFSRL